MLAAETTSPIETKRELTPDELMDQELNKATRDISMLADSWSEDVDNMSGMAARRILKSLCLFKDMDFKKDTNTFEIFSMAEHLLKCKLTILLTNAHRNKNQKHTGEAGSSAPEEVKNE